MAENSEPAYANLTRELPAALNHLVRELQEAACRGDLQGLARGLARRQKLLDRVDWSAPVDPQLRRELASLWAQEQRLWDFCQQWREKLKEHLLPLTRGRRLRRVYSPEEPAPRFVDTRR